MPRTASTVPVIEGSSHPNVIFPVILVGRTCRTSFFPSFHTRESAALVWAWLINSLYQFILPQNFLIVNVRFRIFLNILDGIPKKLCTAVRVLRTAFFIFPAISEIKLMILFLECCSSEENSFSSSFAISLIFSDSCDSCGGTGTLSGSLIIFTFCFCSSSLLFPCFRDSDGTFFVSFFFSCICRRFYLFSSEDSFEF